MASTPVLPPHLGGWEIQSEAHRTVAQTAFTTRSISPG
jgi:hypothetical protein